MPACIDPTFCKEDPPHVSNAVYTTPEKVSDVGAEKCPFQCSTFHFYICGQAGSIKNVEVM